MNSEEKWLKAREILNSNPSEEDTQIAVGLVREAMAEGHAGAFCTMGGIYNNGIGVEKDDNKAFGYYQKSLDMGYERAKLMLARYYVEGKVVKKNLPLAEQYLRDLVAKDDVDAYNCLAQFIFQDVFPDADKDEGVALLEKAAHLGDISAMANLGRIYGNRCNDEKAMYWFNLIKEKGVDVTELLKQYSPDTYNDRCANLVQYYFSQKQYKEALEFTECEAEKGNVGALYALANYCANGLGEERYGRDVQRAIDIYNKLSADGQVHADYMLARMYGQIEEIYDMDKSISYYKKAAKAGDADAQYAMSYIYIYNDGLESLGINKDEAVELMEKAAEQNQKDALCHLACSYLQDPDISTMRAVNFDYEKDTQRGMELLQRAAYSGQPFALYVLAQCYLKAKYVEKDETMAFKLLHESIQIEATPESVNLMGDLYRDGTGTEQNYQAAIDHYNWASQNGNFSATSSLRDMYAEGIGVEKDEEKANELSNTYREQVEWMLYGKYPLSTVREEAKNGNLDAMYQLGDRYKNGDGVEQNIEVASDWWHKAATKGHVPSAHNLGIFYIHVNHDMESAIKWLEKGAEGDYDLSLSALGNIYLYGQGVEADTDKAIDYLTRAANLNNEDAQYKLASVYHDGIGVDEDLEKAKYWFDMYYQNDSPMAHYRMALNILNGDMYENDDEKALEEITIAVKRGCYDAANDYLRLRWYGERVAADRDEVISVFEELAKRNDAVAMYYLYFLNNRDDYEKKDTNKALEYLKASAELGYDEALGQMGLQYMDDGLLPTDYAKGNEYLTQAAQMGNATAMVNIAISYYHGRGVDKDVKRALKYYEDAASLGESYGAIQAALMYYNGVDGEIEPDVDRAVQLLEKYADNDADACAMLASLYELESDKEDNYTWELAVKSYELMKKASEAGSMDATYDLAKMYLEGRGVDVDLEKAKELFNKCIEAELNVDECKKKLEDFLSEEGAPMVPRLLYWYGINERNKKKYNLPDETYQDADGNWDVIKIAHDAAECGERNAQETYGYFVQKDDPDAAFQSFAKAIKQGKIDLALTLGSNYYYGQNGVEEDVERAAKYFQLGLEQEDLECGLYLAYIYSSVDDKEANDYAKELYKIVASNSEEDSFLEKSSRYYLGKILVQEIEEGKKLDEMELDELIAISKYCSPNGKFQLLADAYVKIAEKADAAELLVIVSLNYAFAGDFQTAHEVIEYCESNNIGNENLANVKGVVNALQLNDSEAMDVFSNIKWEKESIGKDTYADLLLKEGKYQVVVDLVSEFDEPDLDMIVARGKAYEKLGQDDKAIADFTKAVSMPIGDDDNEMSLAEALLHLGKYEECREFISKCLEEHEDDMTTAICFEYGDAAYYHCLMGDKEKAIEYFKKSVEMGNVLFDNMRAYQPELMQYPEIQEYICNYKSQK